MAGRRDERNVHGPWSIATPGLVAGHALALERFGTRSWADSIAPALALARPLITDLRVTAPDSGAVLGIDSLGIAANAVAPFRSEPAG